MTTEEYLNKCIDRAKHEVSHYHRLALVDQIFSQKPFEWQAECTEAHSQLRKIRKR